MAYSHVYVDSALGDGGNDGTTPADAWRGVDAIKTGFSTDHAAETKVWYRRTSVFDIGAGSTAADIAATDDGTFNVPAYHIGWPRAAIPNTTITQGDWTNGSRIIDNVVGITPTKRAHEARWATAPDGHKYLITAILWEFTIDGMGAGDEFAVGETLTNTTQTKTGKVWSFVDNLDTTGTIQAVVDIATAWANNDNITSDGGGDAELSENATAVGFLIDREYAGATVTGTNGKFQIEEDDDYDDRPQAGIDAGWDADAHDLTRLDFNNEAYQLLISGDRYFVIKGFYMEDSADTLGIIQFEDSFIGHVGGLILKQSSTNARCLYITGQSITLDRFTIEGSGSALASQKGIETRYFYRKIKNGAIYNCGDSGLACLGSALYLENLNIGSEICNFGYDLMLTGDVGIDSIDIVFGGTNGYVDHVSTLLASVGIENYQKILGNHKSFYKGGEWESAAVTDTNANKKLSDTVLKISPNINEVTTFDEWKQVVFDGSFELASGSQTIKFWLYNDLGQTINDTTAKDNVYLKATYVDSYDDTTEYTQVEAFSTEIDILDAADADDWDYLQVTVNPATASKVRVQLIVSVYDAAGYFLIDPKPVIT